MDIVWVLLTSGMRWRRSRAKVRGAAVAALVTTGDGATSEGGAHEAYDADRVERPGLVIGHIWVRARRRAAITLTAALRGA